jgi:predicted  nucleic acid-binding Zn-ribbon protein
MSSIFEKLRAGASKTAFEADKIMRIRKAEGDIAQIRKQIDTLQERLGEITYLNYVNKEPQGQDSIDYIDQLTTLEQQVIDKQEELKNLQAETFEQSEPTGASSYTSIKCSNCGQMNPSKTKFCANCGTKLA